MVALPVSVSGLIATVDCSAVADGASADVTFAYAGGATEATLRACAELFTSTTTGDSGRIRTVSWAIVTPPQLADAIAAGDVATVRYSAPDLFVDSVAPGPTPPAGLAWVTADAILVQSGAASDPVAASPADRAWADACAAAVSAGITARMAGVPVLAVGDYPELSWAALTAGVESYKRREATFGLTGYMDLQGAAIRVARDYLEAQAPIIARYATLGIA